MIILAREINISRATVKLPNFSVLTQVKFASPSCYSPTWVRLFHLVAIPSETYRPQITEAGSERGNRHPFLPLPRGTYVTSMSHGPMPSQPSLPASSGTHTPSPCCLGSSGLVEAFLLPRQLPPQTAVSYSVPEVITYLGIAKLN